MSSLCFSFSSVRPLSNRLFMIYLKWTEPHSGTFSYCHLNLFQVPPATHRQDSQERYSHHFRSLHLHHLEFLHLSLIPSPASTAFWMEVLSRQTWPLVCCFHAPVAHQNPTQGKGLAGASLSGPSAQALPLFLLAFCLGCLAEKTEQGSHYFFKPVRKFTHFYFIFYVKKAYDSVWHARLLYKLKNIGITGMLFQYQLFLSERCICTRVGKIYSSNKTIDIGLPQGSIIAPILFNIMIHDLPKVLSNNTHVAHYADDIAIWLTQLLESIQVRGW